MSHSTKNKSQSNITPKKELLCSICKKFYDFDEAGFSEKLYRIMDASRRKAWKCKDCIHSERTSKEPSHITFRKKGTTCPQTPRALPTPTASSEISNSTENSIVQLGSPSYSCGFNADESHILTDDDETLNLSSLTMTEKLSRSFEIIPETKQTIYELQEKNTQLFTSLASTQNELDDKIIENEQLKAHIDKLNKEIELLKNLCLSPPQRRIRECTDKKSHPFTIFMTFLLHQYVK